MKRVLLVHWNEAEAEAKASALRQAGFAVEAGPTAGMPALRRLGEDPPDAFVIDLSRLPMQGRDVGLGLRLRRATRHVPLVFAGGEPAKVARVRDALPDATYVDWPELAAVLETVTLRPPLVTVVPRSIFEAYAGTPAAKKLGIEPGMALALVDPPHDFEAVVGPMPEGVGFGHSLDGPHDLTLWFVRRRDDLLLRIDEVSGLMGRRGLWVLWTKKSGGGAGDLTNRAVSRAGLDIGLVDYKVASVDDTWSGIRFARRRPRPRRSDTRREPALRGPRRSDSEDNRNT